MVLDPLSAFSVACNVLQIVETSLRVLGKTAECYKSGAPDEVSILTGNLYTIEGLNDELQTFIPDPLGKIPLSASMNFKVTRNGEKSLLISYLTLRLTTTSSFAYQAGQTTYFKTLSKITPA
ncbi:hypothetical protein LA080_013726 [Diaporthe eres]|uniref:Uncharacterized protein n=1 Tax=Diaporthe vaccinii TaxID=105482 RepID=A0ABR4ETI9_9PEZI|nr:hypothetical protein LA080_013726 [Diaporthe eres]